MSEIIRDVQSFPVQPSDIDATKYLYNSFDNNKTEISAGWIIRFLQERNRSWEPFTYEEINAFYARKFSNGFKFNRLVEPEMVPPSLVRAFAGYDDPRVPVGGGWIVFIDGKYHITEDFIARCFRSSQENKLRFSSL